MSSPVQQRSFSWRFLQRSLAFACATSLLLGSSAKASSTVLAFGQQNPADIITATVSGGVTSLSTAGNLDGAGVSIPVSITNYLGVPQVPFPILAYETFVGVHSTGTATTVAGTISQNFVGTIDFTVSPGVAGPGNPAFLIATFSGPNGTFSGGAGGGSASLSASEPSDTVTFTVPGLTFANAAIALGFSGIVIPPGLSTSGTTVGPFTAQGAGTFSATVVPEPSRTLFGLLCGGGGHARLRAQKDEESRLNWPSPGPVLASSSFSYQLRQERSRDRSCFFYRHSRNARERMKAPGKANCISSGLSLAKRNPRLSHAIHISPIAAMSYDQDSRSEPIVSIRHVPNISPFSIMRCC